MPISKNTMKRRKSLKRKAANEKHFNIYLHKLVTPNQEQIQEILEAEIMEVNK